MKRSYVDCVRCNNNIKQGKPFTPVVGGVKKSGGINGNILIARHRTRVECLIARIKK